MKTGGLFISNIFHRFRVSAEFSGNLLPEFFRKEKLFEPEKKLPFFKNLN